MSNSILVQQCSPSLASIQLNRPDRRNALTIEMLEQLCSAVEHLADQTTTRVVMLSGAGPVFCAGLDLHEASTHEHIQRSAISIQRALRLMRETRLISIVAAQGGAYAGGAGLMAACDIAIGSVDLKIAFPEARRGLIPALICDVLKSKVREGDLRELFLTGQTIDSTRAQQIGLLQRIVPLDQLAEQARQIAGDVLEGGPRTIEATKFLIHHAFSTPSPSKMTSDQSTDPLIDDNALLNRHLHARLGEEAREGISAFIEKRRPAWSEQR